MPKFLSFDFGINLDMIGDADLEVKIEPYSYKIAKNLVDELWEIGEKHYPTHFARSFWSPILDDHYPFVTQGKPYINVIDFDYEWWHTQQDIPEHCSQFSLQVIGKTLLRFINFKLNVD
jgi:Zn-dependent M28 family amino/carboxypeptidase